MAAPRSSVLRSAWKVFNSIQHNAYCPRYMSTVPPVMYRGKPPVFPEDRKRIKEEIPEGAKPLSEILEEEEVRKNPVPEPPPVNIGLDYKIQKKTLRQKIADRTQSRQELEQNARHGKLKIPIDQVKESWLQEHGPIHGRQVADHYGVYSDLFGNAFFYPVVNLSVCYDYDEEYITPVYRGNKIPPAEVATVPDVSYDCEDDDSSLWTFLMTNPDGHLTDNNSEYLHWMVGNIPGNDLPRGEVLCNYLQPFPPHGTGFHRHVFVLFKQQKQIDYSKDRRPDNCTSLMERTFKTCDFYKTYQDVLTPVGLSFFLSTYDSSVKSVYHNVLDMREPVFEYEHEVPYHPALKKYPHKVPFDRYYDRYRDKKDIGEEVMRMKLDMISPFKEYKPDRKYPLTHLAMSRKPSWLKKRLELMHRHREQFRDLPPNS